MVIPMLLAGLSLVLIAFFWLPRLPVATTRKETLK